MRPYIPTDIRMKETAELQKSVAADLNVPDPAPSIIAPETAKSTKKGKEVENPPEHDAGTGSIDNNDGIESSSQ